MQLRRQGSAGQTSRRSHPFRKREIHFVRQRGLPYYIGGAITEREKLFVQTPASFGGRFNIDVRVENEVVGIDTIAKRVEVRRADGSTYAESFDKLLLSPELRP